VVGNVNNNFMYGNGGVDRLEGWDGNDWLEGGAGVDVLVGGRGNDIFVVETAGETTWENASEGYDTVLAYTDWTLSANIEQLNLYGSAAYGAGNSGDNLIVGNAVANSLWGHDGADTLEGGAGADSLWGGSGADTFVYRGTSDSNLAATDFIQDFQVGVDKIDLRALRTGGSDSFQIVPHNLGTGTWILIDLGGNGTEDARVFLNGTTGVQTSDILWDGPPAAPAMSDAEAIGKVLVIDQPQVLIGAADPFDPLVLPGDLVKPQDGHQVNLDDPVICLNPDTDLTNFDTLLGSDASSSGWSPSGLRQSGEATYDWLS